jgi:hypothetical protein
MTTSPTKTFSATTMNGLRFSMSLLLLATALLSAPFAYYFYKIRSNELISTDLLRSKAGTLVLLYLEDNHGNWPSSWDDLKPYYKANPRNPEKEREWEYFRSSVHINFNVDINELRAKCLSGDSNFKVVYTDLDPTGYEKKLDPNLRIYIYLRQSNNLNDLTER